MEQHRNQHKNTMKTWPHGQTSLRQFEESPTCGNCDVELNVHNDEVCKQENEQ